MSATTRITVALASEQIAELRKLTDDVSGFVGANTIVEASQARWRS